MRKRERDRDANEYARTKVPPLQSPFSASQLARSERDKKETDRERDREEERKGEKE